MSGYFWILAFTIASIIFGGRLAFDEKFVRRISRDEKRWEGYPEARKFWTPEAYYHYVRYGIGLSTFCGGVYVLAVVLYKMYTVYYLGQP